MARTRTVFTPETDTLIRELMARGGTAESISKALSAKGVRGASRSTIGRRMAEVRGPVSGGLAYPPGFASELAAAGDPPVEAGADSDASGELPPTGDEVEGADAGTLANLLERARKAGRAAAARGDLPGVGAMGRLELQIQVEMRKAQPPPIADPNDDVDMVKLGKEVAARLHKLVDQVVLP